jgi:deoxyribonucleoside regulator
LAGDPKRRPPVPLHADREARLLLQVAEMYYEADMNQGEIARELDISRPTVSRMLTRAREEGYVRIEIRNPFSRAGELAAALRSAFGLQDTVVVPTTVTGRTPLAQKIGAAAARYLEDKLPRRATVGLGRGATVYSMVHSFRVVEMGPRVVPLTGGLGNPDAYHAYYHANELVRLMAERLGGECLYLYAPADVEDQLVYQALTRDRTIARVVESWKSLDWAVVGIGTIAGSANPEYSQMVREMTLSGTPVADISMRILGPTGEVCLTRRDETLVGITVDQLRRTPHVVGVAGGLFKSEAILAALLGKVVNVLVTDEATANDLLRRHSRMQKGAAT